MVDVGTWISNTGIAFEIIGFVMILLAVRPILRKEENVVTGLDYLENVMSTKHPWINRAGIGLAILGLIGQLVSSFFP
jgi:hypothetical protein